MTNYGRCIQGDSINILNTLDDDSIDLIFYIAAI